MFGVVDASEGVRGGLTDDRPRVPRQGSEPGPGREHLRGARNPFFFAVGIHPVDGRHVRLEGNIDFDERVNTIADFHLDPKKERQIRKRFGKLGVYELRSRLTAEEVAAFEAADKAASKRKQVAQGGKRVGKKVAKKRRAPVP